MENWLTYQERTQHITEEEKNDAKKYLKEMEDKEISKIKTNELTPAQYLKAIKLGYYEPIKCISIYKKLVKHYKVCGRVETLLIELIPTPPPQKG